MIASSSGTSQCSSSNSGDVPSTTGGTLTRMPNGLVTFGTQYDDPSQGSSYPPISIPFQSTQLPYYSSLPVMYPSYSGTLYITPPPVPVYPKFPNAYGFVSNGNAPR